MSVGNADVAYQVIGEEPPDLVYCYGLGSHVEQFWDLPPMVDFFSGLASFSRLVVFDRRGIGASDDVPYGSLPTWEEWAEDIGGVLDAAGSSQSAVLALLEAGPMAILYAASHPERVSALVLVNTAARYMVADDYPIGYPETFVDASIELMRTAWGTSDFEAMCNPGLANDPHHLDMLARRSRSSVTPRAAAAQYDFMLRSVDVRPVLPLIQVPTLVLQVAESPFISLEHGRFIADHIQGALFKELPGGDISADANSPTIIEEVGEFLTGTRPSTRFDRVLASVLFTDIVGSTELAASLGDLRWRSLLDQHDGVVREQLHRFNGREVNMTGDGFVISFDAPARAIRCAQSVAEHMKPLGINLRMGLHTGECEVREDHLGGMAVHIAARIAARATSGELLVSGTVRDLVIGSEIEFADRGEHSLKGVPGGWRIFAVERV